MIKRLSILFCLLALSASALKVVHPTRSDGLTRRDLAFDYDEFIAAASEFSWDGDTPSLGSPEYAITGDRSGQYIDLGIIAESNTTVEIKCAWNSVPSESSLFAYSSANNGRFFISALNSTTIRFGYGDGSVDYNLGLLGQSVLDEHVYSIAGGVLSIDGIERINRSSATFGSSISMYLFARNTNGSAGSGSDITINYVSINGNVFTATSDGGFYNPITATNIYNLGSGVLVSSVVEVSE